MALRTVLSAFAAEKKQAHILLRGTLAPWGPYLVTAMGDDYVVVEGTRKYYLALDSIAGVWEADPIVSIEEIPAIPLEGQR